MRLAQEQPGWLLVWEDECWFSRFAQPAMGAWTEGGNRRRLHQKARSPEDTEAKAVACYGALAEATRQVLLRFSAGQPNSQHTLAFLEYLLGVAQERGKQALVVIWDNASWHKSQKVGAWAKEHNRRVKAEGGVRLLLYRLPTYSPWLNPQEPQWAHCKKKVVAPTATLTARQLKTRVRDYFHSDASLE